ncbi:H-2 class II histocompatibility antigen gamma chain [Dissostichus eleginoides]|uniref:H-2 class II histocompatibility antigen gamma chain n=1 Tax=Dissostichus eleginoides TaxID=100907 RepID=A0AAD9CPZ7_DISEL|nr:H-2 class II histocompatibility antigen gamma chain [Dissostichus eleginoides]
MPNSEIQNQPLMPAPTQQAEINGQGVRPSRAYKVAGLTLLACVLIVGQATIAYFLISQQGDLKTLKEQNDLNSKMSNGRSVPREATQCHLEAAGVKPVQVPGFHPDCDERGLYRAQQCFLDSCWCVDTATGQEISGSLTKGLASCGAPVSTGSRGRMMRMPDVAA